jgi:hypothetical protein
MKNKGLILLLSIFILGFFTACEENLEAELQSNLDAAAGFSTKQDVEAALIGSYNSLTNANYYGLRFWALQDLYAGTLLHTGTFPSFAQFANRNILANNVEVTNMWNTIYTGINRANNVIASAPNINDASFNANNAIAEARLLRGFHYYNLLTLFGGSPVGFNQNGVGVPIFDTPTLAASDATPKPRSSEAEVWSFLLSDIDFAIANLNDNNGVGRANKNVAKALKARMHLARREYAAAEALADEVIKTNRYTLLTGPNFANMFLNKNSSETIWELQFDNTTTNAIAFFYYPTANGGRNEITSAATTLRDLHEQGDLRLPVNVTTAVPVNKTRKYTRVSGEDNVQIIRLAEMYLIRAEAAAQQNKIDAALADLNIIRTRAGLGELSLTDSKDLVDAILKERIIEFAHEGLRWFDIRRTGSFASIGITQEFRALLPIPEREVDTADGVIAQNAGY